MHCSVLYNHYDECRTGEATEGMSSEAELDYIVK